MMIPCFVQFHTALTITGNRVYQLGETSRIRCSTDVPVQFIQWLDGFSRVVRQETSVQELVLDLAIADSHSSSRYTCRVSQGTFMESMMITIMTRRKGFNSMLICFNCNYTENDKNSVQALLCFSFLHSTNVVCGCKNRRETSGGTNIHSNMCS